MSQKSGKKLRKRTDDETEAGTKSALEVNDQLCGESNGVVEEKVEVLDKMGEVEVNGTNDNGLKKDTDESQEHNIQEKIAKVIITNQEQLIIEELSTSKEENIKENNSEVHLCKEDNEEIQEKIEDNVNQEQILENQDEKNDQIESKGDTENEIEPLVLESEEVDPELQFDENSDGDSQKSSPVIRCTTRRSQTRNIPTPKTPKTFDSNTDDKASECSDKPSVLTVPTPELTDTESEVSVFKHVTDVSHTNEKLITKTNEDIDSLHNVSTKAIAGSDTTRNVDLSSYADDEFELSPFLSQSRERSVGETLKLLTSRRSIKSAKTYTLQRNVKNDYKTLPPLPKRSSVEKLGGAKRKNHSDSPDYPKRFKSESPGLLSYFSSPIINIKNRFTKSELPSSTPKLTGYKSKNMFDNTNVSKITLNETEDVGDKKWCTVM